MKQVSLFLVCLLVPCLGLAQTLRVTGTVIDEQTSEPLIGVSILEEGTTNGIITDIDVKILEMALSIYVMQLRI